MKTVSESKGTWHQAETELVHSRLSAPGRAIDARDFIAQPRLSEPGPVISTGRYVGEQAWRQLKQEAKTAQLMLNAETRPGTDALQADMQSVRASVPLNTPGLPGDFAGITGPATGDCGIAAGPFHLLMITGTAWAVFDKAGQQQQCVSLADWFSAADDETIIFNPRVIYDQFCGRWLIAACGRGTDGKSSRFLLSVSQTRNPLGVWWNWSLDAGSGAEKSVYLADGLSLGLDNSAIYLAANVFDQAGGFQYAQLRIISKSDILSGGAPQWRDCRNLRNPDGTPVFSLQAAHTLGTPGIEYLLNTTIEGNSLTQWRLTEPLSDKPQLACRMIPTIGYHCAPDAPQPDTTTEIETGDTRLVNLVFRNGSLWTAHTVAANWGEKTNVSAIQWFQINTGAGVIAQQHIYGHPSSYYFCPTVMVDGRSNLIMVFKRVSETQYPSVRFTGRLSTDLPGLLHPSVLLRESTCPGDGNWGSYNGAAVDPNDTRIWVVGQYPAAAGECGTWIGETSYMAGGIEGRNSHDRMARG